LSAPCEFPFPEIPLLIKQEDVKLPLLNTLEIHAKAAVDFALNF